MQCVETLTQWNWFLGRCFTIRTVGEAPPGQTPSSWKHTLGLISDECRLHWPPTTVSQSFLLKKVNVCKTVALFSGLQVQVRSDLGDNSFANIWLHHTFFLVKMGGKSWKSTTLFVHCCGVVVWCHGCLSVLKDWVDFSRKVTLCRLQKHLNEKRKSTL